VHRDFWGRGITTEAAAALMEYAGQHMGIYHFIAHCDSENLASERVMLKLGFKFVHELGGRKNRASDDERMEKRYELHMK